MFDFLENHEVFDREGDTALVHFLTQTLETAVLVKNYGKENEEVFVLAGSFDDYPVSLEDVANYEWVKPEDKDWSEEGGF